MARVWRPGRAGRTTHRPSRTTWSLRTTWRARSPRWHRRQGPTPGRTSPTSVLDGRACPSGHDGRPPRRASTGPGSGRAPPGAAVAAGRRRRSVRPGPATRSSGGARWLAPSRDVVAPTRPTWTGQLPASVGGRRRSTASLSGHRRRLVDYHAPRRRGSRTSRPPVGASEPPSGHGPLRAHGRRRPSTAGRRERPPGALRSSRNACRSSRWGHTNDRSRPPSCDRWRSAAPGTADWAEAGGEPDTVTATAPGRPSSAVRASDRRPQRPASVAARSTTGSTVERDSRPGLGKRSRGSRTRCCSDGCDEQPKRSTCGPLEATTRPRRLGPCWRTWCSGRGRPGAPCRWGRFGAC